MPYNRIKRPKSPAAIKKLFQSIAERHGRRHDLVICEHIDIAPRGIYGWTVLGVPERYWPAMAELSGRTVEEIASLHRWLVRDHESHPFRPLRRKRGAGAPEAAS